MPATIVRFQSSDQSRPPAAPAASPAVPTRSVIHARLLDTLSLFDPEQLQVTEIVVNAIARGTRAGGAR